MTTFPQVARTGVMPVDDPTHSSPAIATENTSSSRAFVDVPTPHSPYYYDYLLY